MYRRFKSIKRALSGEVSDELSVEERLAILEEKNSPYCVRARLVNCQGAISLRKNVYRQAMFKCAFYIEGEVGIKREGSDLLINLAFLSSDKAYVFEAVLTEFCQSWSLTGRSMKVQKFTGKFSQGEDGNLRRVYSEEYVETATDSPDASTGVKSSTVASNFVESSPMVKFQSIQRQAFVSGGEAEKCHIVPKCQLETPAEKSNPNNMLALSPDFHKLFDGKTNVVPKMRISVVDEEVTQSGPIGRVGVALKVEFTEDWVGQTYGVFLKDGSTKISDTEFRTWVYVEDPEDFANNIRIKYDETTARWESDM